MDDQVIKKAAFFKALGDPTRLKIVSLLAGNNKRQLCVGMLAYRLEITQPAVSQHLRILKNVGIVTSNRDGFHVHYSINRDAFEKYGDLLEDLQKLTSNENACCERGK